MDALRIAAQNIQEGELASARKILLDLLRSDPSLDQAWYLLSFVVERPEHKVKALRHALQVNPVHSGARERLARLVAQGSDLKPDRTPLSEADILKRAALHVKRGNLGTARSLVRSVLRANQGNEYAWYLLSFCVREEHKMISALNQACQINPAFNQARTRLEKLQAGARETVVLEKDEEVQPPNNLARIAKFASVRLLTLAVTVVIGVFLTILIVTKGTVIESEIRGNLLKGYLSGPWSPMKTRYYLIGQDYASFFQGAEGVFQKILVLLSKGLTLNLGRTDFITHYTGIKEVGSVYGLILEFLPRTLILFGATNVLLFLITVFISLRLSRRYGHWLDRLISFLNPLSSIPSWVYGLLLTVFFVNYFHFFAGGRLESWPTELSFQSVLTMGKKLLIPVLAIFISKFFQSVYTWRTFFLIYSTEDYVEMAKAKGLPAGGITRRYILRPTLPIILTRFSMILISIWQEAIIIELFFNVAGIGHLFYQALLLSDMPLIVGLVVTFAYAIALSVFLLDFLYAVVDPRVRVGSERRLSAAAPRRHLLRSLQSTLERVRKRFENIRQRGFPSISPQKLLESMTNRLRHIKDLLDQVRRGVGSAFKQILRYPSAVVGLSIISLLILVSLITVIAIPYPRAVEMWRNEEMWAGNPAKAQPAWVNLFRSKKLPHTIILDSEVDEVEKKVESVSGTRKEIEMTFTFGYPYQGFPKDVVLDFKAEFDEKKPFISVYWKTPQGRVMDLKRFSVPSQEQVAFSEETRLGRKLDTDDPVQALFTEFFSDYDVASQGTYQLHIDAIGFDEDFDLETRVVILGQVHGLAGTDHKGRNLGLALLWGMPLALGFGIIASLANSLITMVIAAFGTWFGGWVDTLVQRINDVNMIIPIFPVLLMVYNWFSNRLWVILGVYILLGIFGAGIKTYRSAFLQVREMPYIEAAQSYGTSNLRLVFRYLIPRAVTILIPQFINMVPVIVFLEATLAYLNMSDPLLPTWGKVIREAFAYGGLNGNYYWWLEPFGLMILTAAGFLLLGSSLERIFDPKLQKR
ncbi:MAG: ABC transporter permease subunit [Anaerolineales bacterium]